MKVEIESLICEWDEDTAEVFMRFCNLILMQKNRQELKTALDMSPWKSKFERNFIWGFGSHHFWANQRNPFNGEPMRERAILVTFGR